MPGLHTATFGFNYNGEIYKHTHRSEDGAPIAHAISTMRAASLNIIKVAACIPLVGTLIGASGLYVSTKLIQEEYSWGEKLAFITRVALTALGLGIVFLPIDILGYFAKRAFLDKTVQAQLADLQKEPLRYSNVVYTTTGEVTNLVTGRLQGISVTEKRHGANDMGHIFIEAFENGEKRCIGHLSYDVSQLAAFYPLFKEDLPYPGCPHLEINEIIVDPEYEGVIDNLFEAATVVSQQLGREGRIVVHAMGVELASYVKWGFVCRRNEVRREAWERDNRECANATFEQLIKENNLSQEAAHQIICEKLGVEKDNAGDYWPLYEEKTLSEKIVEAKTPEEFAEFSCTSLLLPPEKAEKILLKVAQEQLVSLQCEFTSGEIVYDDLDTVMLSSRTTNDWQLGRFIGKKSDASPSGHLFVYASEQEQEKCIGYCRYHMLSEGKQSEPYCGKPRLEIEKLTLDSRYEGVAEGLFVAATKLSHRNGCEGRVSILSASGAALVSFTKWGFMPHINQEERLRTAWKIKLFFERKAASKIFHKLQKIHIGNRRSATTAQKERHKQKAHEIIRSEVKVEENKIDKYWPLYKKKTLSQKIAEAKTPAHFFALGDVQLVLPQKKAAAFLTTVTNISEL